LAYLLKQEKEQQRLLESELRDLREQHERVAVEREKLRANQTQLQTELDQLAQVKKELIDLTRERDELRDRRGSLDADRKQLVGEQAAFEAARDRFDREKKLAVAEQDKLAASVAKLEKQNAALEAVAQRLNQQTQVDPDNAAKFVANLQQPSDDDGGGNVTTAAPAAAAATSVAAATSAPAAPHAGPYDLSELEHNTAVLNQTLFNLVSEKLKLKDQLHRFVELFTKLEHTHKLECGNALDRARVHPVLSSDDINNDWRRCWKRPFIELVKSYHCDQTWRQVLNTIAPHTLITSDQPTSHNGAVTVTLDTGEVGIFKACGVGALSEVAAYHIDRLVGFFRAPAVASRALPLPVLRGLVSGKTSPEAKANLEAVAKACASENGFVAGAMIGWSAESLERLGTPVSDVVRLWFSGKDSWPVDDVAMLPRRLELTRYVMWCYLLNDFSRLLRNGDTFVFKKPKQFLTEGGPFVYLNNAGALWHEPPSQRSLLRDSFNSTFCKRTGNAVQCDEFASLADRTDAYNGTALDPLTLAEHFSEFLATVCMFERSHVAQIRTFVTTPNHLSPSYLLGRALTERELLDVTPLLTTDDWRRVEARIFWLRVRIDDCILKYGESNVIFAQDVTGKKFASGTRA
jgi:hypothetical protein